MKIGLKRVMAAFSISVLLITIATHAFAENGNGTGGGMGNGTGGNSDIALTLLSSSVKSGDVNVLLNPTIDLRFNKNVVNLSVKSNNSKCFHLIDSKGNSVEIKIIFPDDQLRQDFKEHIFISPVQNLAPDSKYSLYIDRTLQAKNEQSIDSTHMIAFTTGQTTTTVADPSLKDLASDTFVYTNKLPLKEESVLKKSSAASSKASSHAINNSSFSIIIISVLAAAIVLFTILFLVRKKGGGDNSNHS